MLLTSRCHRKIARTFSTKPTAARATNLSLRFSLPVHHHTTSITTPPSAFISQLYHTSILRSHTTIESLPLSTQQTRKSTIFQTNTDTNDQTSDIEAKVQHNHHKDKSEYENRNEPTLDPSDLDIVYSTSPINAGNPIPDQIPIPSPSTPHSQPQAKTNTTMSSDDAYTTFLEKADNDRASSKAQSGGKVSKIKSVDVADKDVPKVLTSVNATYTSDTDEDFEPVCLSAPKCENKGEKITKTLLAKVTDHKASAISTLSVEEFDPRGEYREVIEKVEGVTEGGVEAFRVELGGARCEYWIVGLDGEGRIVGVRVGAVES